MINILLYYTLAVMIALTGIENIRIAILKKQGKHNVNHAVTVIIAVVVAAIGYWILKSPQPFLGRQWVRWTIVYFPACFGIRLVFWDVALNLSRRLHPFQESSTTSAKTDHKLRIWQKMVIGVVMVIVCLVIYYV